MDADFTVAREVPRLTTTRAFRLLGLLVCSRLLLLWVARLAVEGPFGRGPSFKAGMDSLADHLVTWDAAWYRDIALQGYYYRPDSASSVAFFPLLPLLIKLVHFLGVDDVVLAGYLVTNLALAGAVVVLWKLAAFEFRSVAVADRAVVLLLFCPGAIWFSMIYTESLFFLLLTLVMLGCRQRRWMLAAVAGYGVALSRVPGLLAAGFVAAEILTEWLERRRQPGHLPLAGPERARRGLALVAPVLGHLSYLGFLQWRFGDWRAQHRTLAVGWRDTGLTREWVPPDAFTAWVGYPLLGVAVILCAVGLIDRRRWSYGALASALVLLYALTTNFTHLPRYLCAVPPLYLAAARVGEGSRLLEIGFYSASVALGSLLTFLLVAGYVIN